MHMILGLALAAPPVSTWTYAAAERPADDSDHEPLTTTPNLAVREPTQTRVVFERPPEKLYNWADEEALTFDLSEDVGRFDYVMVTARGQQGLVAHWRQGPYAGEDASRTFALEWPNELLAVLGELGPVRLTLDVVVVDGQDAPVGRSRLGVTWAALEAGGPVGGLVVDEEVAQ